MDSQALDYWMSQGHYVPPQQQHTASYDVAPGMSKVSSLSGSPVSSTYDQIPAPLHQAYYSHIVDEPLQFGSYHMPLTPSEFGSDHDSPYCSPQPIPHAEPVYASNITSLTTEKTSNTSGRRRAQNRAAQRAFRERKEKHARDLEVQLAALTDKYTKLETSHAELNAAYEKLRRTIGLLTQQDHVEGEDDDSKTTRRKSSSSDNVRRLLEILHGELKGSAPVRQ
jgi:AP-1-like factor